MTHPHEIGKIDCVACDKVASIRINKKGKAYIHCDLNTGGCGTQVLLGTKPSKQMKRDLLQNGIEKTMETRGTGKCGLYQQLFD